jgi:oxygen-independent coproporphyrinogen-3 oxidase
MKQEHDSVALSRKGFVSNYPHFRYWKKSGVPAMVSPPPLNVYIHIPFCIQKCAYCYYKTEPYKNPAQLNEFLDALMGEIEIACRVLHLEGRPLEAVYIGGGTPSLLKDRMFSRIVETLGRHFTMESPEFTVEAEPRTITKKKMAFFKELGVNRLSIGIQSFDDHVIELSGRHHTGQKALEAIDIAREAGDVVVNIDLLSGLAGETPDTWERTVKTAVDSGAHNITVYKMETYLNTEFFNEGVRKNNIQLPDDEAELGFMKQAIEIFGASGYKPWSFFTFTRGGDFHHRYAANLWHGKDCCAFGPSAFGLVSEVNYQNINDLEMYKRSVADGQLPVIRAYAMTSKDRMLRDILLGLKLFRFNVEDFIQRHGFDFRSLVPHIMEELKRDGFVREDGGTLELGPKGILYGDYVAKRLAHGLKEVLGQDRFNIQ